MTTPIPKLKNPPAIYTPPGLPAIYTPAATTTPPPTPTPAPGTGTGTGTTTAKKGLLGKIKGLWGKIKNPFSVSTIKKIPKTKIAAVGIGLAAGIITLYSILKDGSEKGIRNAKEDMGEYYLNLFTKSQTLPKYSNLLNGIRNNIRKFLFDNPIYPEYVKAKNTTFSIAGEVVNNGIPVVLAAGAVSPLLINNPISAGVSIVCAGLLLIGGAKTVLVDVFGIGKKGL